MSSREGFHKGIGLQLVKGLEEQIQIRDCRKYDGHSQSVCSSVPVLSVQSLQGSWLAAAVTAGPVSQHSAGIRCWYCGQRQTDSTTLLQLSVPHEKNLNLESFWQRSLRNVVPRLQAPAIGLELQKSRNDTNEHKCLVDLHFKVSLYCITCCLVNKILCCLRVGIGFMFFTTPQSIAQNLCLLSILFTVK